MLIESNAKGQEVRRGEESIQLGGGDGWDRIGFGDRTFMGLQCKPEVGPPYIMCILWDQFRGISLNIHNLEEEQTNITPCFSKGQHLLDIIKLK